jgi:hypothetical protein
MPTKFSEFFTLVDAEADDLQKRVYATISDATTMVDCYARVYFYIIGGLRLRSQTARKSFMDSSVVVTNFDQQQMDHAEKYFEAGDLTEWENRAMFEYLIAAAQDAGTYGPNVSILRFDESQGTLPQRAYRQVQLYLQIQNYNQEYGRQVKYANEHHLPNLPNSTIAIDPATANGRVDPDSSSLKTKLSTYVNELVKWMGENYTDLKALGSVTDKNGFFNLVFKPGNDELTLQAVQTTLNSIRDLKDTRPRSTRKAFGLWACGELAKKKTFWNNLNISNAYPDLEKLCKTAPPKLMGLCSRLFTDFLSPNKYAGETDPQQRRTQALTAIATIFSKFSSQTVINTKYKFMVESAMKKVKTAYPKRYTSKLLEAAETIPDNNKINTILPEDLSYALKDKADELLRTLPLKKGKDRVIFFTVENFEALEALSADSVIAQDKSKSPVVVRNDPKENGNEAYRPIYRSGFRIGKKLERAVSFGNMPAVPGTFYYRLVQRPAIATVFAKNVFNRVLTINFQTYSIDYPGKKNGKDKNDQGETYVTAGSTVTFFDDLKQATKWTDIKGGRRYDPYYSTTPIDAKGADAHLTAFVAAARGAARTLPLGNDELCLWFWAVEDTSQQKLYAKLGEALGLPAARQIVVNGTGGLAKLQQLDTACLVNVGKTQYTFVNYGPRQFGSGFYYSTIGITDGPNPRQFYVAVNSPSPTVADVLTSATKKGYSRALVDKAKNVLALFNFRYYRRVTTIVDPKTTEHLFTEDSKVIQLFSKNDKRKPTGPRVDVPEWTTDQFDAFGVNLPVCFNVKENVIQYFMDKQSRGKMINKGNFLYRERKPRLDAGTAMSAIFGKLIPPLTTEVAPKKVPATAFAKGAMRQSTAAQDDWGAIKVTTSNSFPVNQEWCHLRGHGDGGDEYPGNFVSGSYHCNTEQLAIETGQRLVTQQTPENSFALHTTAYLLRDANYESTNEDEQKSQILSGNYLADQTAYAEMLKINTARRTREQTTGQPVQKKSKSNGNTVAKAQLQQGDVAPLAAYLRYKVMTCEVTGHGSLKRARPDELTYYKMFDFIFEGQSEFIDKNQFTMISRAVQFALAGKDQFDKWYEQVKTELDAKATQGQ